MRIKRFRARDLKTAFQMVKEELGPEAVILATRELTERGELGSNAVEVTAGVNHHGPVEKPAPEPLVYQPPKPPRPALKTVEPKKTPSAAPLPSQAPAHELTRLGEGLAEVKELLLDLTHRSSLSGRIREHKNMVRLYRGLLDSEVDPALARALLEKTYAAWSGADEDPAAVLSQQLQKRLKTFSPPLSQTRSGPLFVGLVGPSGVGKTTTIAKLAALWSVREQKRVALISLDAFRLGAAEQLRTYARIIGLPVRVVQDKEELRQAVDIFGNLDVVLIDTSGRSLNDPGGMEELAGMFKEIEGILVMLVLSAVTKDRDLAAVIRKSDILSVASLIITKIDETERFGNVINNLIKFKKPVSFLTNGQKVPDDIMPATPNRLAELAAVEKRTGLLEKESRKAV
ncbi:MAG: flagellar biosynthesis protein FlhF [Pseudomonadota bacterium]